MSDEVAKTCLECQGALSPIIVMDKDNYGSTGPGPQGIEYRRPDDSRSFWTGAYPTAGRVRAFLCESCGRIALYGAAPDAAK
ncbi:MAG TPA: hypothetical protein VM165_09195 [Planctomycetaceae bacterium]|nr:hypothetical protein [Planctomycetaceae bacterium]